MFLIDFDDTIFDTQRFKEARLQVVQAVGVSSDLYWQSYREARAPVEGIVTYSNERHADLLARHGFSREMILFALAQTTNETVHQFLFPDTIPFLTFLRQYNQPMALLSLSDPAFQEKKVKGTRISTFFDNIFIVDETKALVVKEVIQHYHYHDIWLFNDRVEESQEFKEQFPMLKIVLKQSPAIPVGQYIQSGLPYFSTLTEIQHYVKDQLG